MFCEWLWNFQESSLLEQTEKKKISLKRSEPPLPAAPAAVEPAAENNPPAVQEEEKEEEETPSAKKIIKLDTATEKPVSSVINMIIVIRKSGVLWKFCEIVP